MNMQAMLKQAQKMQNDMMKEKAVIDETIYEGKSSLVSVKMKGTKELVEVKIDADTLEKDDIEMLQDMIVVAVNEANKQIDKDTEQKMGKFTQGMPGLF
jgi:DNA-binding YbaB/EbfC family protein